MSEMEETPDNLEEATESSVLICSPVEDSDPAEQIPDSIVSECVSCDREIWVSPSGQDLLLAGEAHQICVPCGVLSIQLAKEQGEKVEYALAPGAAEEIRPYVERARERWL